MCEKNDMQHESKIDFRALRVIFHTDVVCDPRVCHDLELGS